ncbi:Fur family transcriptional regulator, ferric uptake regulator [Hymenobacter gelipurpurascens]|uniref:Fur family transcriptional regulator, ferric uptake regulator n=1 Tax=Hymenobacter gelipurpurascens TaxID=89968 RepID=A0A212TK14_9BACT|nr:transcriptional repressor [Hymenobacter gelipurpurascens]SNC66388.1 Fur family transcriptional regulator, ferric uptake regulator [Hymenobacter gelipurpurascens]
MASPDRISQTLSRHELRQTPVRRAVLQTLLESSFALSGHEIEQKIGGDTDRITLYRTLKTFEESGLIHRVIDTSDTVRYAACSIECSAHAHFDNHVHFKCTNCQHIYCLNQVAIPAVQLPDKFEAKTRDYLLAGVCRECQE